MPSASGPLSTPLGQFALGALVLVVGAALLFALIGLVSEESPVVVNGPVAGGSPSPTPEGTGAPTDGQSPSTPPDGTGTQDPTDPATPDPTQEATEDGTTDATEGGEEQFDPASITIQVLDGWQDSSSPNDAVLSCLRDAGYDSLISNDAVNRYDTTVVYYTPGDDNQARAQQVADVLGVAAVEEKPSNLSDSVPVHVVTGGDGDSLC